MRVNLLGALAMRVCDQDFFTSSGGEDKNCAGDTDFHPSFRPSLFLAANLPGSDEKALTKFHANASIPTIWPEKTTECNAVSKARDLRPGDRALERRRRIASSSDALSCLQIAGTHP